MDTRTNIQNFALFFYFFSLNIESFNLFGLGSISFFSAVFYIITILPSIRIIAVFNRNLYFLWPLIALYSYLFLVSIYNMNDFSSRVFDVQIFLNFLIFFLIINHAKKDNWVLDKALYAFALGSVLTSLLLILGIGVEISDEGLRPGRKMLFNSGPNEVGIKIMTGAMIIFTLFFNNRLNLSNFHRFSLALFIPLIFFAVLQTGSRTAASMPIIAGLIWVFFRILKSKYKIIALISGFTVLIALLTPLIFIASQSDVLVDRVSRTGAQDFSDTNGRFFLWLGFFGIAKENILTGIGISGFEKITYDFFGFIESPHNVFLELAIYTGFFGLLLYSLFLYRVVYSSYLLYKDNNNILGLLALPSVVAFTMILQGLSEKTCWVMLAYIVGTYIYNKRESINA